MRAEYARAEREMRAKQEEWLRKYQREKSQRERALDSTAEARAAHEKWLRSQANRRDWLDGMVAQLSESAHSANQRARDALNDTLPRIYAENVNRAAYAVDSGLGVDTGFTMVDEDAVRGLMRKGEHDVLIHEVIPYGPAREKVQSLRVDLDAAKDIRWNRQKFTSAITQGILQGESIPDIVKRTESIFGSNEAAATRAARTATTAAENLGRTTSYERAERLGIKLRKQWLATLDGSTRASHKALDGQAVGVKESFDSEHGPIDYPGDPYADPAETYNCRCSLIAALDSAKDDPGERWARLPEGMTYEEWKGAKAVDRTTRYKAPTRTVGPSWYMPQATDAVAQTNGFAGIAEGHDILGMWQRRPDEFDFEIEDVLNAQGFDGMPRVVSADEFDQAVRAANGGEGLVMQRTYSAPDQTTLDAYRGQLYDGKWYVDCSTGGAQYGQGMYAAADYTGRLSDEIKREMEHYIDLGKTRWGNRELPEAEQLMRVEDWVRGNIPAEHFDAAMTYARYEMHIGDISWDEVSRAVDAIGNDTRKLINLKGIRPVQEMRTEAVSYIETMTLDPSAKVVEWSKIAAEKERAVFEIRESIIGDVTAKGGSSADIKAALEAHPTYSTIRFMDDGAYAAMRGYDAINAVGHGASGSYTVVLNRTKLIIKEPE